MDMPRVTTDDLRDDYERVREMVRRGPVALGDDLVLVTPEQHERLLTADDRTANDRATHDRVACHPADLPDDMIAAIDDLADALDRDERDQARAS